MAVLAYVFFHRPAPTIEAASYEARLAAFHETLDVPSAGFRLSALPFGDHGPGYEDWYLVASWSELGGLGDVALATARRAEHDAVAAAAEEGWGGVWALQRGVAVPPEGVAWHTKPQGETYEGFLAGFGDRSVWQRQLVLGPAPEFAVSAEPTSSRVRVT